MTFSDFFRALAALFRPRQYQPPGGVFPSMPLPSAGLVDLAALAPPERRKAILANAIIPAARLLAPHGITRSTQSDVMMLAIAGQESDCRHRAQIVAGGGPGPARGLWQFERGGGVTGVLTHRATKAAATALCLARGVPNDGTAVWRALQTDDVLAAGFARLLLWSDAGPLPSLTDEDGAWSLYLRCWRPGKQHPGTWRGNWQAAKAAMG